MQTITIPKELAKEGDLVVIPRIEYEEFLQIRKIIPMVKPTQKELRALKRGRKEIKSGEYVEWSKFKRELAHHSR